MKKVWKAICLCLCLTCLCCAFSGCAAQGNGIGTKYEEEQYGFQLELPKAGETIAIMHTSHGDIHIRLFPEGAPKAVENFLAHASSGYYDGLTFYQIVHEQSVKSGDPKADGTGGESKWGGTFEDEFDKKLLNLRGALSMDHETSDTNANGSRFMIITADKEDFGTRESYTDENINSFYKAAFEYLCRQQGDTFKKQYRNWEAFKAEQHDEVVYDWVPEEVWDIYETQGGVISFDGAWGRSGGHTVFGQIYQGLDVVDAIAGVEADSHGKPVKDVVIKSIEITTYQPAATE